MQKRTTPIKREQLLEKANCIIRQHEDFIDGMYTNSAKQKGEILVFSGKFFLNEHGLPTTKSPAAFNMFKYLTHTPVRTISSRKLIIKTYQATNRQIYEIHIRIYLPNI